MGISSAMHGGERIGDLQGEMKKAFGVERQRGPRERHAAAVRAEAPLTERWKTNWRFWPRLPLPDAASSIWRLNRQKPPRLRRLPPCVSA